MGWKLNTFKIIVLGLTVLFFAPNLPPHYEFKPFSLSEPLPLEGPLAKNNILDKASPMQLDSLVWGPESIAIREPNELFTGTEDGKLLRIKNGKVTSVGDFGEKCNEKASSGTSQISCGRIVGMRFDSKGKLLLCDAVNGVLRVDVDTGKWEQLVSMNSIADDGLSYGFPNDLDFDKMGNIYYSDSSTIADRYSMPLEILAGPSGRLVMYNPTTKKNTVLLSKLHVPNGVQLSSNEDFVLVAECMRGRVWRYYLKGKNQGQSDIFVDNLPGLPDNIRPTANGNGFYISLVMSHLPNETSPINIIGNLPRLRRFIVRIRYFLMNALLKLEEFIPNAVLSDMILFVKKFGSSNGLTPTPHTIIVEVNNEGKIVGSLQKENSQINSVSQVTVGKEWTYFASPNPLNTQIYKMKTSDLKH